MTLLLRAVAALLLLAAPAFAQTYPNKQVRIVVPFPAGGSADILCRLVGEKLAAAWGQTVIIDNRAGAFSAIGVLALVPNVITARPDLPQASLKDFIAYTKANPGKATYASQGNGSTSHLSASMLATLAGIELVHVPYKGEGPALVDLTGSRVDIFIGNISAALRFEKAKQARFLELASRTRSPVAPDVPTTAELGYPDLVSSAWFALVAPPGTPDAVVQKVNADLVAALRQPEPRTRFIELGAEPQGGTTAATAAFIKDEEARWRGVIKSANVTLE